MPKYTIFRLEHATFPELELSCTQRLNRCSDFLGKDSTCASFNYERCGSGQLWALLGASWLHSGAWCTFLRTAADTPNLGSITAVRSKFRWLSLLWKAIYWWWSWSFHRERKYLILSLISISKNCFSLNMLLTHTGSSCSKARKDPPTRTWAWIAVVIIVVKIKKYTVVVYHIRVN